MSTYETNRYAFPATAITAGTFDNARLSSGSVTQHVDLSNLSASNLTSGTVPNARYGTPTFSGANITNLSTTTSTGSWTPGVSSGSVSNSVGKYQKVGKFVFCQFELQMTGSPAMGGNEDDYWYFTNLPFTAISYAQGHSAWFVGMGSLGNRAFGEFQAYAIDNTTNFGAHKITEGYRMTQYYGTFAKGGTRNVHGWSIYNGSGGGENWVTGRFIYTASS